MSEVLEIASKRFMGEATRPDLLLQTRKNSAPLSYIKALDGLRGLAVLSVIIFHLLKSGGGFIGVDIFFVLSGFLITSNLLREFQATGPIALKDFCFRRIVRLCPALYAMLLLTLSLSFLVLPADQRLAFMGEWESAALYYMNWTKALYLLDSTTYFGHTWSLAIEEQFYIIWPLVISVLLALGLRSKGISLFIVGLIALSCCTSFYLTWVEEARPSRIYAGLDTRGMGLLIGGLAAFFITSAPLRSMKIHVFQSNLDVSPAGIIGSIILIGAVMGCCWHSPWMLGGGYFVVDVAALLLLWDVVGAERSLIRRMLENNQIVWIGKRSYGLYLWHVPIFAAIIEVGALQPEMKYIVGLPCTFLLAGLSYAYIESPILEFCKQKRMRLSVASIAKRAVANKTPELERRAA